MNLTRAKTVATQIADAEQLLKDEYNYTSEMLEQLGLNCPTTDDYLHKLQVTIQGYDALNTYDDGDDDDDEQGDDVKEIE